MVKKSKKNDEAEALKPATPETEVKAKPKARKKKAKILDPIGDISDGEAQVAVEPSAEANAAAAEASAQAPVVETSAEPSSDLDQRTADTEDELGEGEVPQFKPRPPAKLERLQKILAKAGVASRRKAEEMIEQGRVQVNGKTVTELGTKADAGRDHIRVDGKLLQGAERLRYFVLNKPRGFVTTVKDPEGRPTVMQFFDKMRERLYPVGRLDYMSEGLLVVTNDGELANRLTRAAAGVEKTYLVKVAGIPTEDELDLLRAGVAIERGKPGSAKVRTSPARIRQVRQGDNPWYEVVLIEGRNRELRKMFEEVGHFVEKIRRVGYGPLILDQEPGNLRELDARELELLRKAADGTLRTPKSKELRRRNAADAKQQLPTVSPRPGGARVPRPFASRPFAGKAFEERPAAGPKDYRPKASFETDRPAGSPRPPSREFRPTGASNAPRREGSGYRPNTRPSNRPERFDRGTSGEGRPSGKTYGAKPAGARPAAKPFGDRPYAGKPFERGTAAGRKFPSRPAAGKPHGDRPAARPFEAKPTGDRAFPSKLGWKKPDGQQRPPFKRPPADRPSAPHSESHAHDDDFGPVRPPNLHIEEIHEAERPVPSRSSGPRAFTPRPSAQYSRGDRPQSGYAGGRSGDRSGGGSSFGRGGQSRSVSGRSFRSEGGLARPFTTSSGKPRPGGARLSSKPSAPGGRSSSAPWKPGKPAGGSFRGASGGPRGGSGSRPFTHRDEGGPGSRPREGRLHLNTGPRDERSSGSGWKPKPNFGGPPKPGSGNRSKTGSSGKSGYKGKSSGPNRSSSGGKKRR
jgi:23S rRNA pseudouridine2605 synthase